MKLTLIAIVLIGLAMLLLCIKVVSKKGGKFPETHACKFDAKNHRRQTGENNKTIK